MYQFIEHVAWMLYAAENGITTFDELIPEAYRPSLPHQEADIEVGDIPLRIAADESAHTDKDALTRIQMGYKAIALKAIAKTLSMTMKIAKVAKEHDLPCFCADLTVNPILVDWNKNIAARLDPFPGLGTGLLESNGHQNYKTGQQWNLIILTQMQTGARRRTAYLILTKTFRKKRRSSHWFKTLHEDVW